MIFFHGVNIPVPWSIWDIRTFILSNSHQKKCNPFPVSPFFLCYAANNFTKPVSFSRFAFFFDTLSPIIMLQWRMAVFKRHNYFWRHTHFSRNHDHLDLLVRPNIFQPNGVLIESMVIYHGTKSQNTPKTHIQDDGRFSTHLSNEKILLQWNTSCYLGILILAYEIIPPKKTGSDFIP